MSQNDPGCVKTHTSAKCRKNNSPTRHRTPRVRYDLTLRYAIAPRCFYVSGEHWSFHTTKTRSGPFGWGTGRVIDFTTIQVESQLPCIA
jgi:hypothetical protein